MMTLANMSSNIANFPNQIDWEFVDHRTVRGEPDRSTSPRDVKIRFIRDSDERWRILAGMGDGGQYHEHMRCLVSRTIMRLAMKAAGIPSTTESEEAVEPFIHLFKGEHALDLPSLLDKLPEHSTPAALAHGPVLAKKIGVSSRKETSAFADALASECVHRRSDLETISSRSVETAKTLLERTPIVAEMRRSDRSAADAHGWSSLCAFQGSVAYHLARYSDDPVFLMAALKAGANANHAGPPPLPHLVATNFDLKTLRSFAKKADMKMLAADGSTVLHRYVTFVEQPLEGLRFLIESADVDPNVRNDDGVTALDIVRTEIARQKEVYSNAEPNSGLKSAASYLKSKMTKTGRPLIAA